MTSSGSASCPAADAAAGGSTGFKLGFKFSIPGLLQSCSTSEIEVEGLALADDIMTSWSEGRSAPKCELNNNK